MPAVDVALAMNPRIELAALECHALEVESSYDLEGIVPEAEGRHHHRLGEIPFGEVASVNRRGFVRDDSNRLRADLDVGGTKHAGLCRRIDGEIAAR